MTESPIDRRSRRSLKPLCWDYLAGIATPALCSAINWPVSSRFGQSSVLLIYLLGICLVAARHGLGPSILGSFLSLAGFAYFYAPPLFSLAIGDVENVAALAMMLLVALVTSTLMQKVKVQAYIASCRERRATDLYRLSRALAPAHSEVEIMEIARQHIQEEYPLSTLTLKAKHEGWIAVPTAATDLHGDLAQAVLDRKEPITGVASGATGRALLGLPMITGSECLGALVIEHPRKLTQSEEQRLHLELELSLIAQSIQRLRLIEHAQASLLKAETETVRNSLLNAISHDLRTPLTALVGAADTLAEKEATLDDEQRRELVRAMQEQAQSVCDLADKILDMARLSAGGSLLRKDWNVLEEIVGGALGRAGAALRNRVIDIQLPDDLPLVFVDPVLLQQVLVNLLDNAAKYSPTDTPIDICAALGNRDLSLMVADRGPGLSELDRQRIFEKFYRVNPELNPSGVGLGLAICRAIVEAHGGTIRADNRLGGGSVFTISLPLAELAPPELPAELEEAQ